VTAVPLSDGPVVEGGVRVVAARPGGAARPLFVVLDEVSGGRLAAGALASIEGDIPVFAVHLGGAGAARTIQGIAANVVRAIRRVQPRGPYRLAGWLSGGIVAYETAAQLVGADEDLEFLALVETECLDWEARRSRAREPRRGEVDSASLDYEVPRVPVELHVFCARDATGQGAGQRWAALLPPERVRALDVTPDEPIFGERRMASLGRALSDASRRVVRSIPRPEHAYSPLVSLQAGDIGAAPTFCIPGAGAGVTDFIAFGGALGAQYRIYGFQPRGMEGELVPHSSVEAAAGAYLRALAEVVPRGAVHLVGHSFGGWVAFEMALRLQAAGRPVASLGILDTEFPGGDGRLGGEYSRAEALMALVSLYEQAAEQPLGVTLAELEARDETAQVAYLHGRLVKVGLMPLRSSPSALRGSVRTFEVALRTQYRPERVLESGAKLVLVASAGETSEAAAQRFQTTVAGWRRFAPNLRIKVGDGNHVTLLKPPNVARWAEWIGGPPCTVAPAVERSHPLR
jgi:thioesterase domain-containing protein